jgi:nucleoside-diphosphate-sugar epimerase
MHTVDKSGKKLPSFFKDSGILITGGAGFVGSNLVRSLLAMDIRSIHIVDNLLSSEKSNIPSDTRIRFTRGSISDDKVLTSIKDEYDYIFHLSTYHGNQSSIFNPLADHENNQLTTLKLFEQVKKFKKLKKVVYSAAGCAVAEKTFDKAHATLEDAPISLEMDSPYSISKIVGEFYSVYYHKQHNLPIVRARFQNVYGPGEILGAGEWRGTPATVWRNVVPTFVYKAIKKEPLPIDGKGDATRDFIYVDDIIQGLELCAAYGKPGDVYNLASGKETSILDLANTINELSNNPSGMIFNPARDWDHSGRRFGSTEKSRKEIKFNAEVELGDGLKNTIAWTQKNIALIDTCIQKHKENLIRCQ